MLAAVNIISPFFGCYIGGAGLSRSALANSVSDGNHLTQLYAIGTVLVVAIVLLCMVDMLKELPVAVLGSVVLMALRGLIRKLEEWRSYWNVGRSSDFVIWIVTMLTTIFLDLDYGKYLLQKSMLLFIFYDFFFFLFLFSGEIVDIANSFPSEISWWRCYKLLHQARPNTVSF